ncbi:MAG: sugar phosphate isomerase/epimerase family protein [Tepidisphaerales bacterium]
MNINGHDIGVCSWSLRPKGMEDLVSQVRRLDLEHMQISLLELVQADEAKRVRELAILKDSGIKLTSGMMHFADEDYTTIAVIRTTGGFVPDSLWPVRKELTVAAGRLAAGMGLKALTVHAGFIPPSNHETYAVLVGRLRELAAAYAAVDMALNLETGQESAHELLQFLNDLGVKNVSVNFDPANMILYGSGDPIDAVHMLGRHIRHVHVKDAVLSAQPGTKWGDEVPFGVGQVGPWHFLQALAAVGYTGPMCIEREAGEDRFGDVQYAIQSLKHASA